MLRRPLQTWTIAVACLVAAAPAWAQEASPVPRHHRDGFYFGIGFGYGWLTLKDSVSNEGGISASLRAGTALNQHISVGVDLSPWYGSAPGLGFGTLTGTIQGYPSATGGFFLAGGLGLGIEFEGEGGGIGPALVAGLGYDLRVDRNISFTPYLNEVLSSINDSYAYSGPQSYRLTQVGLRLTIH